MLAVLIRHRIKTVPSLGTFKHPDNDKCVLLPVRGALSCLSNLRSHDFPIDPFCASFRSMRDILDHVPFFLLPLPTWKDFSLKQNLTAQIMGLWEQQWSGIKMLGWGRPFAWTHHRSSGDSAARPGSVSACMGPSGSLAALNICCLITQLSSCI